MKYAVIDIGSNSICLVAYEINENNFKTLFKEKIMAGLAGYVKKGILTDEGIEKACSSLNEFKHILDSLSISQCSVFATASLRNISNTEDAVEKIYSLTGFKTEVVSGYDEAVFSCKGAMKDTDMENGVFIDIGGGSTEIAVLDKNEIIQAVSIPLGSLKLYSEYVSKILPKKSEITTIKSRIKKSINDALGKTDTVSDTIFCVGGTARAILKIASALFGANENKREITPSQLEKLSDMLCGSKKSAAELILKNCPDRINTLIPGILILNEAAQKLQCEKIIVSKFGVREGYLCQRVLKKA